MKWARLRLTFNWYLNFHYSLILGGTTWAPQMPNSTLSAAITFSSKNDQITQLVAVSAQHSSRNHESSAKALCRSAMMEKEKKLKLTLETTRLKIAKFQLPTDRIENSRAPLKYWISIWLQIAEMSLVNYTSLTECERHSLHCLSKGNRLL